MYTIFPSFTNNFMFKKHKISEKQKKVNIAFIAELKQKGVPIRTPLYNHLTVIILSEKKCQIQIPITVL